MVCLAESSGERGMPEWTKCTAAAHGKTIVFVNLSLAATMTQWRPKEIQAIVDHRSNRFKCLSGNILIKRPCPWDQGPAQLGGFASFPICPACDAHGSKAVIGGLKPRHRRCSHFSSTAGRPKGRGISSFT